MTAGNSALCTFSIPTLVQQYTQKNQIRHLFDELRSLFRAMTGVKTGSFQQLKPPYIDGVASTRNDFEKTAPETLNLALTGELGQLSPVEQAKLSTVELLHIIRAFTHSFTQSPYSIGVVACWCAWSYLQNRRTAVVSFSLLHTSQPAKPQHGAGVPPPGCVPLG